MPEGNDGPAPSVEPKRPRVFLSYSRDDESVVKDLYQRLRTDGFDPWMDQEDLLGGRDWWYEIEKEIQASDAALVCLSRSVVEKPSYLHKETTLLLDFADRFPEGSTFVIPVRLDECEVPKRLSRWQRIDYFEKNGYQRLLRALPPPSRGEASEGPEEKAAQPPAARGRRILPISVLTAIAGLGWMLAANAPTIPPTKPPVQPSKVPLPRPSVAVTTFENRSGDRDLGWLSTALAEAVSAKLGTTGDIRVVDRHEVSLAETDLSLVPRAEASPRDLGKIRGLLGVELILGGAYGRDTKTSPIRLTLSLSDASTGRVMARTTGEGEVSSWLDLAARSAGNLPDPSIRKELRWPAPSLEENVRAVFPASTSAMKLYVEGLERYRRFDTLGASGLFAESAKLEPHPLVLAALARTHAELGQPQEGSGAIQTAKRLVEQTQNTPRALPERYLREIEIVERKVASDEEGVADRSLSLFRELFVDDVSYGLRAALALVEAGSADLVKPLLDELRLLPLAESHPRVDHMEADALLAQQQYLLAQPISERAIEKARVLGAVQQEALGRLQLASILSHMGYRSAAQKQFMEARVRFRQTGDRRGEAKCLEHEAFLYVGSDIGRAEHLFQSAIQRYEGLGDQQEKGRVLDIMSSVLMQMGELSAADRVTEEAAGPVSPLDQGLDPYQEAVDSYHRGDLAKSQELLEEARAIFRDNRQRDDEASVLGFLGEIALMQGRLPSAENLYSQALNSHLEIDSEVVPYDQVGLARVHMAMGKYPAARIKLNDALRWMRSRNGASEDIALHDAEAWTGTLLAFAELEVLTGNVKSSENRIREVLDRLELLTGNVDDSEDRGSDVLDHPVRGLRTVRSRALALQARILLGKGKTQAAWDTVSEAKQLAQGDFRALREAGIAAERVRAALGKEDLAVRELEAIAADAAKREQVSYQLESLLAAGEIELARLGRGRRRLEELRDRAAKLQFGQFVQRASLALEE